MTPKESGLINTTFVCELLLLCLLKIRLMVPTFLFSMSAQTMMKVEFWKAIEKSALPIFLVNFFSV